MTNKNIFFLPTQEIWAILLICTLNTFFSFKSNSNFDEYCLTQVFAQSWILIIIEDIFSDNVIVSIHSKTVLINYKFKDRIW